MTTSVRSNSMIPTRPSSGSRNSSAVSTTCVSSSNSNGKADCCQGGHNATNDAHLMASLRGMRIDLAIKEKAMQRLTRDLDECKRTIKRLQREKDGRTKMGTSRSGSGYGGSSAGPCCLRPRSTQMPSSATDDDQCTNDEYYSAALSVSVSEIALPLYDVLKNSTPKEQQEATRSCASAAAVTDVRLRERGCQQWKQQQQPRFGQQQRRDEQHRSPGVHQSHQTAGIRLQCAARQAVTRREYRDGNSSMSTFLFEIILLLKYQLQLKTLQAAHERELASCQATVHILQQRLTERDEAFDAQKRREQEHHASEQRHQQLQQNRQQQQQEQQQQQQQQNLSQMPVDYMALKAKVSSLERRHSEREQRLHILVDALSKGGRLTGTPFGPSTTNQHSISQPPSIITSNSSTSTHHHRTSAIPIMSASTRDTAAAAAGWTGGRHSMSNSNASSDSNSRKPGASRLSMPSHNKMPIRKCKS